MLSKSKYLIGLQCPKYLWMVIHRKNKVPGKDENTRFVMEQGKVVGEYAKKLFPKGIDIPTDDFEKNIEDSRRLIEQRKTLFEAAVVHEDLYSRADILVPVAFNQWDVIEVKSSTRAKEVNLHDLAFQRYVYEMAGLKIRKMFLMHLNNKYVKDGEIDVKELFKKDDLTDKSKEYMIGIEDRIKEMRKIVEAKRMPKVTIHIKCNDPYGCPFEDQCRKFLPEHNVFDLYRSGKSSFELFERGIVNMEDVPEMFRITAFQKIQIECAKKKKVHVDKDEIRDFISKLKFPLYFLDFETYSISIPIYDGTRPYQNMPFQYSLHVVERIGEKPKHYSFLHDGKDDPRKKFISSLKMNLGKEGSVIVYYQQFENRILKEVADFLPPYKKWVEEVKGRVVDLLVPFKKFHYYNPKQKGSASLKAVLPALTGKSYKGMNISDGQTASVQYYKATFVDANESRKKKVMDDLEEYCGLDTEGMIWILEKLMKLA